MKSNLFGYWDKLAIAFILVVALTVRIIYLPDLIKSPSESNLNFKSLTNPIADWHSWRQADTASVTRELVNGNATWLIPEYHDLSNIPSGIENPEGYRMVEFPIYNVVSAWVTPLVNGNIVVASRLVSIAASLITILALYVLVLRLSGDKVAATTTAAFFALIPYSIYYSRTILPEPTSVLFSVLSILGFSYWITSKEQTSSSLAWYAFSVVSFALALLVKPTIIFIAPVFVAMALATYGLKVFLQPLLWLYLVSLLPLIGWRGATFGGTETDPFIHIPGWIEQYPEGIPASKWLLNGNGIRLRPAWWRWLFADRLSRLILGYWGVVLVALGAISQYSKKFKMFDVLTLSWVLGMLLYLVIFATGNVQHDYYQVQLIPILSILFGRGISWLTADTKDTNRFLKVGLAIGTTGLMLLFSWFEVSGYFNINNPAIVSAGQAVDRLTPTDSVVIAPYQGDTAFLYQTNRRGWPIGFQIDERIKLGATHYVTTAYDDEAKQLESKYLTIEKTDDYLLLDLTSPADTVVEQQTR